MISKELFRRVVEIMKEAIANNDRQSTVTAALYGCNVLDQVEWDGSNDRFATKLVETLDRFGWWNNDLALVLMLQELKSKFGIQKREEISTLIEEIEEAQSEKSISSLPSNSITEAIKIALESIKEGDLEVWVCHWRVVLYSVWAPGNSGERYGASIFLDSPDNKQNQLWKLYNWPPPASHWMMSYVKGAIKQHMETQRRSLKDYPCLIYREWTDKTAEYHIAEEIYKLCIKLDINPNEMDVRRIRP